VAASADLDSAASAWAGLRNKIDRCTRVMIEQMMTPTDRVKLPLRGGKTLARNRRNHRMTQPRETKETSMSHDAHDAHGHAVNVDISDAEWQELQAQDVKAGRNIIMLMGGIFVIGIILYAIVNFSILS
jgi:hypothetical protein